MPQYNRNNLEIAARNQHFTLHIPIMFRIRKQQLIDEGISPESGIDKG